MVQGSDAALIRPRLDYQTMLARDVLPDWLKPTS
jgi:hypothetical protein